MNELQEYIKEEIGVLKDLGLWKYCTSDEKATLRKAKTENQISHLMRTYRERYYDIMCEEYEEFVAPKINIVKSVNLNALIKECPFKRHTINALLRNQIYTLQQFVDVVSQQGWLELKGVGVLVAKEVIGYIMEDEEDLDAIVEKLKNPSKNAKKYIM